MTKQEMRKENGCESAMFLIVEASDFGQYEVLRSSSLESCSLLYLMSVPLWASVCVDSKGLVSD